MKRHAHRISRLLFWASILALLASILYVQTGDWKTGLDWLVVAMADLGASNIYRTIAKIET